MLPSPKAVLFASLRSPSVTPKAQPKVSKKGTPLASPKVSEAMQKAQPFVFAESTYATSLFWKGRALPFFEVSKCHLNWTRHDVFGNSKIFVSSTNQIKINLTWQTIKDKYFEKKNMCKKILQKKAIALSQSHTENSIYGKTNFLLHGKV